MSVLGSGVAAGVAQTGLQAQQVAQERDRRKAQEAQAARRVRETFDAHLHAAEDVDTVSEIGQARIDGHLPQDRADIHSPPAAKPQDDADEDQPIAGAEPDVLASSPNPQDPGQLYHHLDVKG